VKVSVGVVKRRVSVRKISLGGAAEEKKVEGKRPWAMQNAMSTI
jgi:hypothetical protein